MERLKRLFIALLMVGATFTILPDLGQAQLTPPILPAAGTSFTCSSLVKISSRLGSAQPLKVSGHCVEDATLGINDNRQNITILGKGTGACGDPANTTLTVSDPSESTIINVRGTNITITGFEIFGLSSDPTVDNRRGIRAQRGGTLLVGRNTQGNGDPTIYLERSGVCIRDVGKAGIEAGTGSVVRVTNTEIKNVGGDGISVTEGGIAEIGFTSGGEFGLTTDAFPGPGVSGPNNVHNTGGAGANINRNSAARIVGNTFASNKNSGINVATNSHADIADNLINGNGQFAVQVTDNSNVNLGTTGNTGCGATNGTSCAGGTVALTGLANSVTVTNTTGAIRCVRSVMAGRQTMDRAGTVGAGLLGNGGTAGTNTFTSCTSSLN